MPELPEVEIVRRGLAKVLIGQEIARVEVRESKSTGNDKKFARSLVGRTITGIDRIGKLLIFTLDQADTYLLAHLRMTGQMILTSGKKMVGGGHTLSQQDLDLPGRQTRLVFYFRSGATLFFNDQRKFGYIKRATAAEVARAKAKFGPEPLAPELTLEYFTNLFTGRKTTIKALLLDQSRIAGLGNIYVDEACFRAGVRPSRRADTLSKSEREQLWHAVQEVIKESIAHRGTTFYSFADASGKKGNFSDRLRVFNRTGQPCLSCGGEIKKTRVAGRGTHYCATCQK
jgi:formamidopyrimidine-DNA glycosylase